MLKPASGEDEQAGRPRRQPQTGQRQGLLACRHVIGPARAGAWTKTGAWPDADGTADLAAARANGRTRRRGGEETTKGAIAGLDGRRRILKHGGGDCHSSVAPAGLLGHKGPRAGTARCLRLQRQAARQPAGTLAPGPPGIAGGRPPCPPIAAGGRAADKVRWHFQALCSGRRCSTSTAQVLLHSCEAVGPETRLFLFCPLLNAWPNDRRTHGVIAASADGRRAAPTTGAARRRNAREASGFRAARSAARASSRRLVSSRRRRAPVAGCGLPTAGCRPPTSRPETPSRRAHADGRLFLRVNYSRGWYHLVAATRRQAVLAPSKKAT